EPRLRAGRSPRNHRDGRGRLSRTCPSAAASGCGRGVARPRILRCARRVSSDTLAAVIRPLPEPHLVVSSGGDLLRANPAAAAVLPFLAAAGTGSILDRVAGDVDAVRRYLADCSRTGTLLPGRINFGLDDGSTASFRCYG